MATRVKPNGVVEVLERKPTRKELAYVRSLIPIDSLAAVRVEMHVRNHCVCELSGIGDCPGKKYLDEKGVTF